MAVKQPPNHQVMGKLPIPPLTTTAYTTKTSKQKKTNEEKQAKKKGLPWILHCYYWHTHFSPTTFSRNVYHIVCNFYVASAWVNSKAFKHSQNVHQSIFSHQCRAARMYNDRCLHKQTSNTAVLTFKNCLEHVTLEAFVNFTKLLKDGYLWVASEMMWLQGGLE